MASVEGIIAAANESYVAAEHGNFRGMDSVLADLAGSPRPSAAAWDLTLRALRWSFHPDASRAPEPVQVGQFIDQPDDDARRVAARACGVMERVCIATLDASRLATWIDVHAALAPPPGDDVALRSARLWHRLFIGDIVAEDMAAKDLFDEASRKRSAAEVIESTVLRGLLALSVGAMDDAVELARRGSRMAQSECLPQLEYLANLTLARVRRYGGRPHLALHILAALARVAPPAWSGWIGWGDSARWRRPSSPEQFRFALARSARQDGREPPGVVLGCHASRRPRTLQSSGGRTGAKRITLAGPGTGDRDAGRSARPRPPRARIRAAMVSRGDGDDSMWPSRHRDS